MTSDSGAGWVNPGSLRPTLGTPLRPSVRGEVERTLVGGVDGGTGGGCLQAVFTANRRQKTEAGVGCLFTLCPSPPPPHLRLGGKMTRYGCVWGGEGGGEDLGRCVMMFPSSGDQR